MPCGFRYDAWNHTMKTKRSSSVVCEACESRRALPAGSGSRLHRSFRICRPCADRVDRLSLRPLEWYNLAKRHGPHHNGLDEQFYSPGGIALMSDDELEEEPHLLPAPVLQDVAHDLDLLWVHTLTRRSLGPKFLAAWRRHPKKAAANFLAKAWDIRQDDHARHHILSICRHCLGKAGAALIRRAWKDAASFRDEESLHLVRLMEKYLPDPAVFEADDEDDDGDDDKGPLGAPRFPWTDLLPSASARCLPQEEAWQHALTQATRHGYMGYFTALRDPRALDWIETHLPSGTYPDWGGVAAVCGFSWDRALRWLQQGRPLSHLALDALRALILPLGDPDEEDYGIRLLSPPDRRTLGRVLKAHARRDAVPRVQKQVDFILHHAPVLLEGKPYGSD